MKHKRIIGNALINTNQIKALQKYFKLIRNYKTNK